MQRVVYTNTQLHSSPPLIHVQRLPFRFETDTEHGKLAWRRENRTWPLALSVLCRYEARSISGYYN